MPASIRLLQVAAAVLLMPAAATPAVAQVHLLGPPETERPVPVRVGLHLIEIVDVDDRSKTFEFEAILTLRWQDDRQRFDPEVEGTTEKVYQGDYQFSELFTGWWPQLVLRNESGRYEQQGVVLRVRPDGSITYVEEFQASAEVAMDLHKVPFDQHRFEVTFETLAFDDTEVLLTVDPQTTSAGIDEVDVNQWRAGPISGANRTYTTAYTSGDEVADSSVVFGFQMTRVPGFLLRMIVLPLFILVALSWSVFWMDTASLGDRMAISFVGILTVVAFQIIVADMLPQITYFTLLSGFLFISYFTLVGGVIENLRVGALDKQGNVVAGNRLDRTCRWLFPLAYVSSLALMTGYFFLRY